MAIAAQVSDVAPCPFVDSDHYFEKVETGK